MPEAEQSDSEQSESIFSLPSLGADMESGTILEWYVQPGDLVSRGDLVARISTDKSDIDVEIWQNGTVLELLADINVELPVGSPLVRLTQVTTLHNQGTAEGGTVEKGTAPATAVQNGSVQKDVELPEEPKHLRSSTTVPASPYARSLAVTRGIDLGLVSGTGPDGAVLGRDLEQLTPDGMTEDLPVGTDKSSAIRQRIADRMAKANSEIPHYYLELDIDLHSALDWLHNHNESKAVAERVLIVALFLKATAHACVAVPELNGFWKSNTFEPARGNDVAVVVSLRGGGLMTPKIGGVANRSVDDVMADLKEIVAGARRGSMRSGWMTGAGITVTNLGDRGADRVSGVIFPPQVGLIGFGAVRERPWIVDGVVEARPVVTISLAADHRASDGLSGGRFLAAIAQYLENLE